MRRITDGPDSERRWSPDGTRLVFTRRLPQNLANPGRLEPYEVYTIRSDGSDLRDLTPGQSAVWSPDGSRVAFIRVALNGVPYNSGEIGSDLYVIAVDGTHLRRLTAPLTPFERQPAWR